MFKLKELTLLCILNSFVILCFSPGYSIEKPDSTEPDSNNTVPPVYTYEVVNIYPHDEHAFTQGLLFYNGFLYESTGPKKHSSLRKVDLKNGKVLQVHKLDKKLFGEGIAVHEDKIIQLTYKSKIGIVYNIETFTELERFDFPYDGWGLTYDGDRLIASNGTDVLYFLDPQTFKEIGQIKVYGDSGPVSMLNELEYIKGEIYANVWMTDSIARINPDTGRVTGWIDLKGLMGKGLAKVLHRDGTRSGPKWRPPKAGSPPKAGKQHGKKTPRQNILNGIAYDKKDDRLFVTGKFWPKLFEIRLVRKKGTGYFFLRKK